MRTILVAAALCAVASPAFAGGEEQQRVTRDSVVVSYSDLDLSDAADRATLNARIDAAVRRVCRLQSHSAFGDATWCRNTVKERTLARASERVRAALARKDIEVAEATSTHMR